MSVVRHVQGHEAARKSCWRTGKSCRRTGSLRFLGRTRERLDGGPQFGRPCLHRRVELRVAFWHGCSHRRTRRRWSWTRRQALHRWTRRGAGCRVESLRTRRRSDARSRYELPDGVSRTVAACSEKRNFTERSQINTVPFCTNQSINVSVNTRSDKLDIFTLTTATERG